MADHADLLTPLEAALTAARALPAPGWASRIATDAAPPPNGVTVEPATTNPAESFFLALRTQVLARLSGSGAEDEARTGFAAECDLYPVAEAVTAAADVLETRPRPHRRAAGDAHAPVAGAA